MDDLPQHTLVSSGHIHDHYYIHQCLHLGAPSQELRDSIRGKDTKGTPSDEFDRSRPFIQRYPHRLRFCPSVGATHGFISNEDEFVQEDSPLLSVLHWRGFH